MLVGTTIFICDKCKNKFKGLAFECNCTSIIAPQLCTKCGSYHTMPSGWSGFRSIYESIWKNMDESGVHGKYGNEKSYISVDKESK